MTDQQRINALRSLVGVLTSALKIVRQTHYTNPPMSEFTPAKTKGVVETALITARAGESL
jgi:hypothetical protein